MKNITFSAQEDKIEKARTLAAKKNKTLNDMFRDWLDDIGNQASDDNVSQRLNSLWEQTSYLRVGKKLSRDEINER
ncbi:MAG TPA: antitoxin [Candidatus Saccharimonadia bacterium]|jgi:hypothetical protein